MRLVFLGPPGAGKGTQARRLTQFLRVPHISTGEMLRQACRDQSDVGRAVADDLKAGRLVPDSLINEMIDVKLARPECLGGYLLDGYPRTTQQAFALEQYLARQGLQLDGVLELRVSGEELIKRLAQRAKVENRSDDTPEVIRERFESYRQATQPLVDFYAPRNQLYPIEGLGSLDEVFERIVAVVDGLRRDHTGSTG